jgi:hypothetical protein
MAKEEITQSNYHIVVYEIKMFINSCSVSIKIVNINS